MSQLVALKKLSELEMSLESAERTLRQLNISKEISEKVREHKEIKSSAEAIRISYEEKQHLYKAVENTFEGTNYKLNEIKEKLYGGKINNLKQLGGLLEEQEKMQEEVTEAERMMMSSMENLESMEKEIDTLTINEKKLGSNIKKMITTRQKEMEGVKVSIQNLNMEIEEIKRELNLQNLEIYNDIKKRKNRPVVAVNIDICTGCNMDLPIMTMVKVKRQDIVVCDNCGRILFLQE